MRLERLFPPGSGTYQAVIVVCPAGLALRQRESAPFMCHLPGDVKVLPSLSGVLEADFLGASAARCDPLGTRRSTRSLKKREISDDVDCASFEVPRARAATHSAVALKRAATAGNSEVRMNPK